MATFDRAFESSSNVSSGALRPTLLMCAPTLYTVDYVINPWMQGNVGACSRTCALTQWHALHDLLAKLAHVELIEPVAGSPDMVFTANAGLVRDDTVVLSRFRHVERQGEERHFREWFLAAGYRVADPDPDTFFEGEGDALFSAGGSRLWVGHGLRSSPRSHAMLREVLHVEVTSLRLIDPRFYHLDTCFAPLAGETLLYYPAAFDASSLAAIEASYPRERRIAVPEQDAVRFACNAISLDRVLVMNQVSSELASELRERGFTVLETPLSEFLKAGGAAKCLVLQLSPSRHAPRPGLSSQDQVAAPNVYNPPSLGRRPECPQ